MRRPPWRRCARGWERLAAVRLRPAGQHLAVDAEHDAAPGHGVGLHAPLVTLVGDGGLQLAQQRPVLEQRQLRAPSRTKIRTMSLSASLVVAVVLHCTPSARSPTRAPA
ncbi:MAG: hypothetical protein R2712_27950 [Vicinamibacterales bacterium]